MAKKRNLVQEIEEIRSRQGPGSYPVLVPLRLLLIARAFEQNPTLDPEFLRYIPIGIVACVEGFVRSAVKELIDAGPPFIDNAAKLTLTKELKADFDLLKALHGRSISIGELFAHLIPINSLENVIGVLTTMIGDNFSELVAAAHDRWATEIEGALRSPILADPNRAKGHLSRMFELRHIYAHELAQDDAPDRQFLGEALSSSVDYLKAAAEVVGNVMHPGAALTTADMVSRAARDLQAKDASIDAAIEALAATIDDASRRESLRESQVKWLAYRDVQATFEADGYRGGTIMPLIRAHVAGTLASERLDRLSSLLEPQDSGKS